MNIEELYNEFNNMKFDQLIIDFNLIDDEFGIIERESAYWSVVKNEEFTGTVEIQPLKASEHIIIEITLPENIVNVSF